MTDVWSEYEEKVNDIQYYLHYLEENENNIPQNIIKIQKANIFLMLYNLVESTINKSLEETHNKIIEEQIQYKFCIREIQKFGEKLKIENYEEIDIFTLEYKDVQSKKILNISGNLDARKIREFLDKYKIPHNKRVIGKRLKDIKDNRNNLAHGDISFSELGRRYAIADIKKYYKECKLFLREYLQNVERYIKDKGFKISYIK